MANSNLDDDPANPDVGLLNGQNLAKPVRQVETGKPPGPRRPHRRTKSRTSPYRYLASNDEWVTARGGAEILGNVDPRVVARLAAAGRVGVRDLPGVRAKYWRADLVLLIQQVLRPARVAEQPAHDGQAVIAHAIA